MTRRQGMLPGLGLLPLLITACQPTYRTNLENGTTEPLALELITKLSSSAQPRMAQFQFSTDVQSDQTGVREYGRLMPGQTISIGQKVAFFPTVPLDGDTLLIHTAGGKVKQLYAKSIDAFVTDTATGSDGVEGRPYVLYTIKFQ